MSHCGHAEIYETAQPNNQAFEAEGFQYPVVVRRSSQVEIEANGSKVFEVLTPESEHWRGLQLGHSRPLLDYPIGAKQDRLRDRDPERFRGLQVYHQL
jgi:hypothetical protein